MLIDLDQDRCIGSGNCVVRLRGHFAIDHGDTIAHVVDGEIPADKEGEAVRVIAMCPAGALSAR